MTGAWREVLLGDVVDMLTGNAFKSEYYALANAGDPRLLGGDNIGQGSLRWDNVRRWPRSMVAGLDSFWLAEGDVVLAMDRPWIEAGLKRAVVGRDDLPVLLVQRTARLRGTNELDTRFLRYVIGGREFSRHVLGVQTGTAIPHISPTQIKAFRFLLPSRAEQRAIAHILGTLDDKIELNRKMNETLEQMARALFKSWFVDFDPVRAKAEGRKLFGMDEATPNLFPDGFEDSVLGKIPRGWSVCQLKGFVTLQRGTTYKSSLKGESGPYLLGLGSIERNGGFRGERLARYSGDSPSKLILHPGDLYVSLKDVTQAGDLLGAVARVPSNIAEGRLTQDTVKLDFGMNKSAAPLLYRALLTPEYRDYCRGRATGTTNLGLSRDDFLSYKVVMPDDRILSIFNLHLRTLERRMELVTEESGKLEALRDGLLPRLLAGELSIGQAKSALDAAL